MPPKVVDQLLTIGGEHGGPRAERVQGHPRFAPWTQLDGCPTLSANELAADFGDHGLGTEWDDDDGEFGVQIACVLHTGNRSARHARACCRRLVALRGRVPLTGRVMLADAQQQVAPGEHDPGRDHHSGHPGRDPSAPSRAHTPSRRSCGTNRTRSCVAHVLQGDLTPYPPGKRKSTFGLTTREREDPT